MSEKTEKNPMKNVGWVIFAVILGIAVLAIAVRIMLAQGRGSTSRGSSRATSSASAIASTTITITSAKWSWVKVNGKKCGWGAPRVNGVIDNTIKYWVVANDPNSKATEMPKGTYVDTGDDVHTLYFRLMPNQGSVTAAEIPVRLR